MRIVVLANLVRSQDLSASLLVFFPHFWRLLHLRQRYRCILFISFPFMLPCHFLSFFLSYLSSFLRPIVYINVIIIYTSADRSIMAMKGSPRKDDLNLMDHEKAISTRQILWAMALKSLGLDPIKREPVRRQTKRSVHFCYDSTSYMYV